MEKFIGTWKLEKNNNFDDFLKYYGYGWIKRKLALTSNIDLTIKETEESNKIIRIIDSTFLKAQEEYLLDDQFHKTSFGLEKRHKIVDGKILSEIKNEQFHWYETNKIEDTRLFITRKWFENNNEKTCSQIFIKV